MQIADDRLRLIFTCCHPALAMDARVALTLRTLGGLTTPEIARAFLVPEPTLAQRLVRAKRKIRDAGIPYRVPPAELLPERLDGVLRVLYLVFNEGYAASSGDRSIRRELCAEAIRLARVVVSLLPDEPEARGLLALMLLHDARREARVGAGGELILLDDQDRGALGRGPDRRGPGARRARRWRRAGRAPTSSRRRSPRSTTRRPRPADTDWPQIATLYRALHALTPTPVVELNLAAAVAMADGPAVGLAMMDGLAAARRARRLPVPPRGARRPAPPARALVGGRRGLPARARADDERPGARVPRGPDPRDRRGRRRPFDQTGTPSYASRSLATSSLVICSMASMARFAPAASGPASISLICARHDLPRKPEAILQPAALAGLATAEDE